MAGKKMLAHLCLVGSDCSSVRIRGSVLQALFDRGLEFLAVIAKEAMEKLRIFIYLYYRTLLSFTEFSK